MKTKTIHQLRAGGLSKRAAKRVFHARPSRAVTGAAPVTEYRRLHRLKKKFDKAG